MPEFRVQGSGFRGSEFRVQSSGFRVQGSGCRVQGSGFKVQSSGFRIQGWGGRGGDRACEQASPPRFGAHSAHETSTYEDQFKNSYLAEM